MIKNDLSDKNKSELYYAFIYSKIQYGIETYGQAKASLIQKLQVKQSKAIEIPHDLEHTTPTTALHLEDKNILLVKDIARHKAITFVQQQQMKQTPDTFKNTLLEMKKNTDTTPGKQTTFMSPTKKQLQQKINQVFWI